MYHSFIGEDGNKYGSFETFHMDAAECEEANSINPVYDGPGWYWWACFPGCLPDCEPAGPFDSEQEATDNANDAEVMY